MYIECLISVIAVDTENHRVVLLNPTLVFLRGIKIFGSSSHGAEGNDEESLHYPYRVALDEASGRLFIRTEDKNIFVFRVFY